MTYLFDGDDLKLCESIEALLALDASGCLVPHPLGGHARILLATAALRLRSTSTFSNGIDTLRLEP